MRYRRKNRRSPWQGAMLFSFAAVLVLVLWSNSRTTGPVEAFIRAEALLESPGAAPEEQLEEATDLLELSKQQSELEPWSLLLEGKTAEKQGRYEGAVEKYRRIPESSAASLESRLAVLRLRQTGIEIPGIMTAGDPSFGEELSKLERLIEEAYRPDLKPEILFLQAQSSERAGQINAAATTYQQLRALYPRSPLVAPSRAAYTRLASEFSNDFDFSSLSRRLENAKVLLGEGEFQQALAETQAARKQTQPPAAAYFESLLLEEQVLRKLKRSEEADEVLLSVAAEGSAGTADQALLKVAKNAWNVNDHHRAIEFISKLRERFPKSQPAREARYIEARILEEMELLPDAKEIYVEIGEKGDLISDRSRSLKRLAWLYMVKEDYRHAAQYFEALRLLSEAEIEKVRSSTEPVSPEVIKDTMERTDENEHATYWQAAALSELKPEEIDRLQLKEKSPPALLNSLLISPFPSYYAVKAAERLGSNPRFSSDRSKPGGESCQGPSDLPLAKRVAALRSRQELSRYLAYEIDWWIAGNSKDPVQSFQRRLARTFLHSALGSYKITIDEGEALLRAARLRREAQATVTPCTQELVRQIFPAGYWKEIKAAAEAAKLDPNLMIAIARTESHFDPFALSSAGAVGLVQVMPNTAKLEGWNGTTDLYDVALNTQLGAKHLARHLNSFSGGAAAAIAAYNAGPSPVHRWRARFPKLSEEQWIEQIGYPETYKYVKRVTMTRHFYAQPSRPLANLNPTIN